MKNWIKQHPIKMAMLALPLVVYFAFYLVEIKFYRSRIPVALQTEFWPKAIYGDDSIFGGGCGAAIFYLTDETADTIRKDGINFFKNVTYAEGWLPFSNGRVHAIGYSEWRETPMPPSGVGWRFGCDSSLTHDDMKVIMETEKRSGSFYAKGGLFVSPELSLVIYTYYN